MNPNRGEGQLNVEQRPGLAPELGAVEADAKNETLAAEPEAGASKQPPPQAAQPTSDDVRALATSTSAVAVGDDDAPTQQSDSNSQADRIEKQWVDSAKQVISQTKDDPYKQKNAMSRVKADYIKYRFNKIVKADTEVL